MPTAERSVALLLLGTIGDLARRMLLPSMFGLHEDGLLNPGLRIVGTARLTLDDEGFRNMARAALDEFPPAERTEI